ncbi:hypothetical protein J437_LFUL008162 [Ladona fulva]|uniref:Uncharacterized protein n=1 Tax=Ladona fulva TaxID=123851 RepID=A0A8K0P5W6_LADFU|nr:hypothetical protein J437_LFUL008162 [Ladona fulva]
MLMIVGDRERSIDQKPESLVYVEGVEAQALFNFLMGCRSCVAPTGALAGIPPTLLSPVAFKGAALGALKVTGVHSHNSLLDKQWFAVLSARDTSYDSDCLLLQQKQTEHMRCESFRSLFQLVRARQCPFFYLCANSFTCLFRAAGIAGVPEMHAILSPTTRGLRAALKDEDVVFSMPLKKEVKGRTSDEGYETLECTHEEGTAKTDSDNEIEAKDEDEETSEWLERMGVTEAEIKRLQSEQAKIQSERWKGAAPLYEADQLKLPRMVRHSVVRVEGESFHSVEMRGPILPHSVHSLTSLLSASNPTFSATFANVNSTKAFSMAKVSNTGAVPSTASVFEKESLSDSGLMSGALEAFCCPSNSFTLDNLKFSDSVYSWTCS